MSRVLVPIDGSDNSLRAVAHVIEHQSAFRPLELHLLNVQPPIMSGNVRRFIDSETIRKYHLEEGEHASQRSRALLDKSGVSYIPLVRVGHIAEAIATYAKETQCDLIVMGSRGLGGASGLWLGSVTTKTVHLVGIPVMIVK